MGTWGMGIFESDDAGEFLDKIIEELVIKIRGHFTKSNHHSFMFYASHQIIPAIDIIITLVTHYESSPIVDVAEAKNWKEEYLKIFDEQMPIQSTEEDFAERRQIVVEVFDKLIKLGEEWDAL